MDTTFSIKNFDSEAQKVKKKLTDYVTQKVVTVGIHEDNAAVPNEDKDITYAVIGAALHFGTENGRIPARPWLDVGVENSLKNISADLQNLAAQGKTTEQMLDIIGVVASTGTAEYVIDLRTPPNAPSTIEAKGSDNPLVNHGHMAKAVQYKISG